MILSLKKKNHPKTLIFTFNIWSYANPQQPSFLLLFFLYTWILKSEWLAWARTHIQQYIVWVTKVGF